ncbi:MAG: hypothetical protein V3U92_01325 [Cellulophaga sp.]
MIKKQTFLFATIFMCDILIGYAQTNSALETSLQLLQKPPEFQFSIDSTGFSKLKKSQFYSESGDADTFIINSKNIHYVDFNNDGNKDIIYQDTRHYKATILFVKKGDNFVEIWSGPGKLIEVKQEEAIIYVKSHSVACHPISMLIELTVNNDNTIADSLIMHHNETIIKNIDKIFEQKKVSGMLRTQPVLDDKEKKNPCTGNLRTGNRIEAIKNIEVTVIKKQEDWLLVVYKEKDISIIGWIKN